MSYSQCEDVLNMDFDNDDNDYSNQYTFNTIPPGNEGFDISHEGGECEIYQDFAEELAKQTGM